MSALPADAPDDIPSQDETHLHIHELLTAAVHAVLQEQPELGEFVDHRPQRDRPSGDAWNGLETMCHVSALLVTERAPDLRADGPQRLLDAVDAAVAPLQMRRQDEREDSGVRTVVWRDHAGVRLDLVIGVRVALRAISMPFLPGSLQPLWTTSPASPISPLTPPPRPLH